MIKFDYPYHPNHSDQHPKRPGPFQRFPL
jgi:hypothetical protein